MLHEFASMSFEDVCREYVRELQKSGELPFRYSKMGRWWGKTTVRRKEDKTEIADTEIDLLAISKNSDKYLVGECKFKSKPFRYSEYLDATVKLSSYKEKSEFYYYLFSESGFDENIVKVSENDSHIVLCDLDMIVGYK